MKYEEQGGPALRDLAELLRNFGDPGDVTVLLRRTTFNMAVGNADAHAKNFSVLHDADGPEIRLAPLYDVLSTIALELTDATGRPLRADTHLGQRVGGEADVTEGDLGQPGRRGRHLGAAEADGGGRGRRYPRPGPRRQPGNPRGTSGCSPLLPARPSASGAASGAEPAGRG